MDQKNKRVILYILSAILILLGVNSIDEAFVEDTIDIASEYLDKDQVKETGDVLVGSGAVVYVVDGDTAKIMIGDEKTTVRLIGIDTPETVRPDYPVECYGQEASQRAKDLLVGTRVTVTADSTQDLYDKHDRLLAYLTLEDGRDFGEVMIREGYAYEFTYKVPYVKQGTYKEAENYARQGGVGLWAEGSCIE